MVEIKIIHYEHRLKTFILHFIFSKIDRLLTFKITAIKLLTCEE